MRELLPLLIAGLVPFAVLVLIILGTFVSIIAWQPPILQTIRFGTANSENGVTALASDPTGIYAAGFVGYSNVTPTYMFVTKYGFDGHEVWTQHFGNPDFSEILSISIGADGVYVAGYVTFSSTNESSFVAKYDFNGNQIWNSQFFRSSFSPALSISSSAANAYVAGYNGTQFFVKDYNSNGTPIWTKLFGSNPDRISVLAKSNNVYVAYDNASGSGTVQEYDSNWSLHWTQTCSCQRMGIASDGIALYVFGRQTAGEIVQGFLTKYDLNGNQLWTSKFNPPPGSVALSGVKEVRAAVDSSGIYLATTTTSDSGGVVMKYDANGNQVWSLNLPWITGSGLSSSDVITVQQLTVFVGGDLWTRVPTGVSDNAFLATISESSSLVFFGLNPPFSFVLLGMLIALAAASILFFRRAYAERMSRHPRSASPDRFRKPGVPTD